MKNAVKLTNPEDQKMDCASPPEDDGSSGQGVATSALASRLYSKLEELRSVLLNEQSSTKVLKDVEDNRAEVKDNLYDVRSAEEECSLGEEENLEMLHSPQLPAEPSDSSLKKFDLNENNRDGCYVCHDIIFGHTTAQEICDRGATPEFLQHSKVDWRIGHETNMAFNEWKKIVQEVKEAAYVEEVKSETEKPIAIEVEEIEECSERNTDDDVMAGDQKVVEESVMPVVEEPRVVKRFPLTRETRKKHIEKETVMKKEEKREAVLLLKKKHEELRRLKEEFKKQAQKQQCHKEERKQEYERRKQEYLETLAKERNVDLEILKKHGDEIYGKYRKECKLTDEIKERKLEEEIAIVEKLLREEKLKEKQEEDEYTTRVSKKSLHLSTSWYKKKQDSMASEKEFLEDKIAPEKEPQYRTGSDQSLPKEDEIVEKADVASVRRVSSRKQKFTPKTAKAQSKMPSQLKLKHKLTKVTPNQKILGTKRTKHSSQQSKLYGIRRFSQYIPPVEELKNLIDTEFLGELNELQNVWSAITDYNTGVDYSPTCEDDLGIGVSPEIIIFHDFFPAQTQFKEVKIYNRTKSEVTFGLFNILIQPVYDEKLISVWPPDMMKLWPGQCRDIEVLFSPIEWGTAEEIKAKIWFWSRHKEEGKSKRNRTGRFSIEVRCLRATANPVIVERAIDFPEVDWRYEKVYTKNLVIENRGALACTVYIHRSFELAMFPEEETLYSASVVSKKPAKNTPLKGKSPKVTTAGTNNSLDGPKRKGMFKGSSAHLAKQKNEIELEAMKVKFFIISLLDMLLDEVCSPFRISLTRGRNIDGYTAAVIPIKFAPYMMEGTFIADDFINVTFEGVDFWMKKEIVTLSGSLLRPPIDVEPSILDMSVLIIDGRFQQKSFLVRNKTDKFLKVKINMPKGLQKHFQLLPSSFTLRPNSENKIILKAKLGLSLCEDALEYLFEDASILEFRLEVEPENFPSVYVVVLATVAEALGLHIEPDFIDFKVVNTTETAVQEFWVSNHTLVAHDIAFLNVPKWGMIMPDYGFTTLPPCESRRFELLYSPNFTEAGKPGGQAEHSFTLKCTTVQVVASFPNLKNLTVEEIVRPITEEELKGFQELRPIDNNKEATAIKDDTKSMENAEELIHEEGEEEAEREEQKEEGEKDEREEEEDIEEEDNYSFLYRKLSDYLIANPSEKSIPSYKRKQITKKTDRLPPKQQMSETIKSEVVADNGELVTQNEVDPGAPCPPTPELYAFMKCRAVVVDPICQLSQQKIVLPATPITSYSVSKVFLRCPSEASGHSCDCGVFKSLEKDPRARVKAHFQFIWSNPFLQIEPSLGDLSYGEKITIRIYFNPDVTEEDIKNGENLFKAENARLLGEHKKKYKGKRKSGLAAPWGSSGSLKHDDSELYNLVKMEMLKKLKERVYNVRVQCLIETQMTEAPFTTRTEVLNCIILCPVVRPDFFLKAPKKDQILEFPMTGVGLTREQKIEIHNISRRTIFLQRNLLGINDVFYTTMIPGYNSALPRGPGKGVMLEPEQYLTIKVIYAPEKAGEDIEYMEFKSNLTRVRYKLRGEAKNPSFKIHPQFSLAVMEAFPGQRVEETIMVSNTGDVPINFRIISLYEKEAVHFLYEDPDVQLNVFNRKTVLLKNFRKCQLMNNVNNWIANAIENTFTPCKLSCPITIEPQKLILEQGKRGKIKITLNFSSKIIGFKSNVSQRAEMSKPEKTPLLIENNPDSTLEMEPSAFAKCVLLTFGGKDIIATWTILSFLKRRLIKDKRAPGSPLSTAKSDYTKKLKKARSKGKLKKDGRDIETDGGMYTGSNTSGYSCNSENEDDSSDDKIEMVSMNGTVAVERDSDSVLHNVEIKKCLQGNNKCKSPAKSVDTETTTSYISSEGPNNRKQLFTEIGRVTTCINDKKNIKNDGKSIDSS